MTFVLEKVSEADIEKYGLREINKKTPIANPDFEWVFDRERDMYLRCMGTESRIDPYRYYFNWYWKGVLLAISFQKHGEGKRGGKGSTTWDFDGGDQLPAHLMPYWNEFLVDIKEALTAYGSFGTYSTIVDHTAYFKF